MSELAGSFVPLILIEMPLIRRERKDSVFSGEPV